ncbi:globin domain-containing protein [Micromonospora sp. DR5-3]|uniref:globin domain-containing protein n=1 Tax=unclassified Micromonospora TaxID=2617518 RepID=UPI0011D3CB74|nr:MULTISPECIES: globin domain-containing protein [unclassified Micromonospora]MCW3818666.1 globin domain-containing protein [Micromonospora sp. DR5-3]TYC21134.1 globin [Micromonospora sp. MP36]
MDAARLKQSWSEVASHGDQVALYFYSMLFLAHPDTRQMFPTNMAGQRDRLVTALGHIVSNVDQVDSLVGFLQDLGADHRKFAVRPEHYPAVGEALLATLQHFLGEAWTDELAQDWTAAYGLVSQVMIDAAQAAEAVNPPWWVAEILGHERRSFDVAVLTLRPQYLLPFTPGQSIGVSHPAARAWRYYSPANAPRADGTLELHVRAAPGGTVSSRLVYGCAVGDQIHLAAPLGDRLTLRPSGASDLLLLGSGTGWAPLKSLVEQVAVEGSRRRVDLYVGARSPAEFYDNEAIEKLAASYPWLAVTYVVGRDLQRPGEFAHVVDRALTDGDWRSRHVYICGSDEMVSHSVTTLSRAGYHQGQLHHEGFGKHWYGPTWRTAAAPDDSGGVR